MHLYVDIITLAESVEDAKSNVRCWINDYADKEFFDWGDLEDGEKVVLLDEARDALEKQKAKVNERLQELDKGIQNYKETGDRGAEGYLHKLYADILLENVTDEMPFFNIENWDWSLPVEVPEESKGFNWYAVRVDLHF